MEDITTPREKILKKVRASLLNKFAFHFPDVDQESEVFHFPEKDLAVNFAKKFTSQGGGFVFCHNAFDFNENLITFLEKRGIKHLVCQEPDLLKEMQNLGLQVEPAYGEDPDKEGVLVSAEALIARSGAVMLSSQSTGYDLFAGRGTVLIQAKLSRLAPDMKQAMVLLKNRYGARLPSLFTFVHGPAKIVGGNREDIKSPDFRKELIVFLINDK